MELTITNMLKYMPDISQSQRDKLLKLFKEQYKMIIDILLIEQDIHVIAKRDCALFSQSEYTKECLEFLKNKIDKIDDLDFIVNYESENKTELNILLLIINHIYNTLYDKIKKHE